MTMRAQKGMKIRIAVELATADGQPIESSGVEYVQGAGTMLRGLEAAIEGMQAGEAKEGVIPARDAFGTLETLPTRRMPRSEFPRGEALEVGRVFQAKDAAGNPVSFEIVAVEADACVVRFLHPLAGKDIRYKVKVLAVVDPAKAPRPPAPPAEALLAPDDIRED